jgi:type I restriction enzyme, S subunit
MTAIAASLVSGHLDVWTAAIERNSGAGRGGGKKVSLYGIERLRALILNLAVRGKLIPQDGSDEPAATFLKRLKYSPKPAADGIPQGWAISPLSVLGTFTGGITPSKSIARFWGPGCPWVSPKDMGKDTIEQTEDQITQCALDETSLQVIPVGSLLMVARSGILRRKFPVAITRVACTINQDMKALILKPEVNARFLQILLQGFQPRILTELVKRGMTVESLIFNDFAKAPWPVPPLSEQQRIVAKVDELMALCDSLESESAAAMRC